MARAVSGESPCTLAVDAHVHLRRCFDISLALDHAFQNLRWSLQTRGADREPEPFLGVLLLAETPDCHPFGKLAGLASCGAWSLAGTDEEASLIARDTIGSTLLLAAGRQVTTRERLEVLSLGSATFPEDGAPIETTLEELQDAGGLAVLPWGFGKWWGRRGGIARRIVASARPGQLFLGDNGNRPAPGIRPALFREAEASGLRVLPGSDPLPMPRHVRRLGGYGCVLWGSIDLGSPAESLKRLLRDDSTSIAPIGRRERPLAFVLDQVRLRGS